MAGYDIDALVRDPDFQGRSFAERKAILREADAEGFATLPEAAQSRMLVDMKGQEWWTGGKAAAKVPQMTQEDALTAWQGKGKAKPVDTRKVNYTGSGYTPNQPAKSGKEFARNLVQDVVELPLMPVRMLSDVANSPDTPQTLMELGKGLVRGPLEFVPGVGEALGGRSATEAWSTNPGYGGMTLAGLGAVAKATRGAKGAAAPKVEAPVQGGGLAEKAATKLYDMTLKQGTTLKPEIRRQNVREGLEGGYLPNNKGVDKLASDVRAIESSVGEGIKAGDAAGVKGTFDRAIANLESLREQAMRSADPEKNLALIDEEILKLRNHPIQEGVTPPPSFKEFSKGKMGPYMKEEGGHGAAMQRLSREYKETKEAAAQQTGSVPIGELQKMKVEQGRHVKYQEKSGQPVDPFKATIDKARIRGFKEELETQLADVFPELKDQNAQLSRKYKLQDVLERAANRIENNQGIGIGLPIKGGAGATIGGMVGGPAGAAIGGGIGTLIGIIEHPAVAPRLAVALHRASKGKMTMAQANTQANERLKFLKSKLNDDRGMVGKDIDKAWYHGTRQGFEELNTKVNPLDDSLANILGDNEAGAFFTTLKSTAEDFAQRGKKQGHKLTTEEINRGVWPDGANIRKSDLEISNPKVFPSQDVFRSFVRENFGNVQSVLKTQGFDGILIKKPGYSGKTSKEMWAIIFDPAQEKPLWGKKK
jgi:hypothetical protein